MSLVYSIPKTAKYIQTSNTFTAAFNVPTLGLYDFNVAGNRAQNVTPVQLNRNSIYLINRVTVAGTIPQEEYLFNIVQLPVITLRFTVQAQKLYPLPIPVVKFQDEMEAVAWFYTDMDNNFLTMDLDFGQLSQDAFLVGVPNVKINVSLSMFEIADNGFVQAFKNPDNMSSIGYKTNLAHQEGSFIRIN